MNAPVLKEETITRRYWDCGTAEHRHVMEGPAQACMLKRKAREERCARAVPAGAFRNNSGSITWTYEARACLLASMRAGKKQSELARDLGLSSERVRQLINLALRAERAGQTGVLSTRAQNVLKAEGLETIDQIKQALADYTIHKAENCGPITVDEIRAWVHAKEKADAANRTDA